VTVGDSHPRSSGHKSAIDVHEHLNRSPTSPRSARGLVRSALTGCREDEIRDTAELLISELVTNALLHAGTDLVVHVEQLPGTVRIAVDDGSDAAPSMRSPDTGSLGGRGLPLVAMLANRWGWEPLTAGKRVWFEVGEQTPVGAS
jgi:anti-sigma regulatory factor (Ser/Thr protein kinase)